MSPPDDTARACEAAQEELHALLDGEQPACSLSQLWEHVGACDRCAHALAHDRALRRAVERLRGTDRAPPLLRERLRRLLDARGSAGAPRGTGGGGSRST